MTDAPNLPDFSDFSLPDDDLFADLPPWAQVGRAAPVTPGDLPALDADQRRAWIVVAPHHMGMALVGLADRAAHQAEMKLRDLQVNVISPDSKLAPPGLLDLGFDALDDPDDGAPGLPPQAVGKRIASILDFLHPDPEDVKFTITDARLEIPAHTPFLLWYALEPYGLPNNVLLSTHFMDPTTWGEPLSETLRLATIERRLTAALINVLGVMLGHEPCHDPECYLYRPIERVRRLDYMTRFVGVHADLLNTRLTVNQEQQLRDELAMNRSVLNDLEKKQTQMGAMTPRYILIGIEESRREIERIMQQLDEANG